MRVLRHAERLCRRGGVILDLTSVPPAAAIERDGVLLGRLDQAAFLDRAAKTEEAVDRLIAEGMLTEEASLAFDVLKHFDSGPDLIADVDGRAVSRLPHELREALEHVSTPVVEHAPCLLRRLRVRDG